MSYTPKQQAAYFRLQADALLPAIARLSLLAVNRWDIEGQEAHRQLVAVRASLLRAAEALDASQGASATKPAVTGGGRQHRLGRWQRYLPRT